MPTTLEISHTLRGQFSATSIDVNTGVLHGCVVAKAGVQATGKFVFLDASGAITRDEKLAKKKVPVFTDAKTLETLMAAAKLAGKRVKSREDHNDELGARVGFADSFKRVTDDEGDRVIADIHVFKTYKNRAIVLETAAETPEEIGLSIDFTPTFELIDGKALMRVTELHGVDMVDEGAITPDGLFLSARVDKAAKVELDTTLETQPPEKMAAPTPEEIMSAVNALGAKFEECMKKMAAPAAPVADPKVDEALKSVNELKTQLSATTATIAQMKREKALLGVSAGERAALAAAPVEDIEKHVSEKKDYLSLVAAHVEKTKCKKSEAHVHVMRAHSAEYREHLNARGIRPGEAKVA